LLVIVNVLQIITVGISIVSRTPQICLCHRWVTRNKYRHLYALH